jgi:DNA-binding transcriptional LysR family regulator
MLPTAEARRLFSETEKFMTGVERIENTARGIRQDERGEIAVAAYPALSLRLVPRYAAKFLAERPEVRLSILTRNSPDISNSMQARAADFGLSLVPSQDAGLKCVPFEDISMVCALPRTHKLARGSEIDLAHLNNEKLIGLGRDDLSHRIISEALAHAGVSMNVRVEAQMADTACVLVSEGLGIAFVPSVVTIGWNDENIVFLPIRQRPRMTTWLYTSAWEPMPNLAYLLLERLRAGLYEVDRQFLPRSFI